MSGTVEKTPAQILLKTIGDDVFREELDSLSRYAAGVKQERQIVWLLAKHLDRAAHRPVVLEARPRRSDLHVLGNEIEVKYHLEGDLLSIRHQLDRNRPWPDVHERAQKGKKISFDPLLEIVRDLGHRKPDLFLWVVACRQRPPESVTYQVVNRRNGKYSLEAFAAGGHSGPDAVAGIGVPLLDDLCSRYDYDRVGDVLHDAEGDFTTTYNFFLLEKRRPNRVRA